LRVIQAEADAAGRVDWNVPVDSSIAWAHQHSATAKRSAREDRTVLVEHRGAVSNDKNPRCRRTNRAITPSAARAAGRARRSTPGRRTGAARWPSCSPPAGPMMLPLLAHLRVQRTLGRPRTRPDWVLADKAYSSRADTKVRTRGWEKSVVNASRYREADRRLWSRLAWRRADQTPRGISATKRSHQFARIRRRRGRDPRRRPET
jgi:hypothetical protein